MYFRKPPRTCKTGRNEKEKKIEDRTTKQKHLPVQLAPRAPRERPKEQPKGSKGALRPLQRTAKGLPKTNRKGLYIHPSSPLNKKVLNEK